jgi:hypothetical protein
LQAKKQTRMAEQHKADDGHGVEQGSISWILDFLDKFLF